MKVLAIAQANLVRTLRDRRGLFFLLVLPMVLIIVLGLIYGGSGTGRVGVVDGDGTALSRDLVAGIGTARAPVLVRTYTTQADLRDAVERGYVELGIVIPSGYEATLRNGGTARIQYVAQAMTLPAAVAPAVDEAIAAQDGLVRAARFAAEVNHVSFDQAFSAARAAQGSVAGVSTKVESVGDTSPQVSGFTLGAQSQLLLFMFLTSLTAATQLIVTRELGVSRRMFGTPTAARTIILGEALGRFLVAFLQGLFIVGASWLLFGVDWVDPFATGALVLAFALVATGAAMLIGSIASNTHQAGSIGPALGMLLGLLGGTMVPPEIFPPVMRTLSHLTPHAWALDGFRQLSLRGGGLVAVLPDVAVLLGIAAVLLAIAATRFRSALVGGISTARG
jgi:ABC-2 type transport system permease protein